MSHVLPSSVVHALKDAAEATVHTATDLAHTAYDLFEDSPVIAALPGRRRSTGPSTFVKAAGVFLVVGLTATAIVMVMRARQIEDGSSDEVLADHLQSVDGSAPVNV